MAKKIDVNSERVERAIHRAYDGFKKKDMSRAEFSTAVKQNIDRRQNAK